MVRRPGLRASPPDPGRLNAAGIRPDITHDLATVNAIADWVVVMHQGKVVQQGPKEQVLKPPHHPYTELLLSSVPEMDPRWLDGLLARRATAASAKMAPVA